MKTGAAIRPEFQLDDGVVYLNHGAYGATPRIVARAQDAWRARFEAQPSQFARDVLPGALRAAAADAAGFVGARGDDVVFVENATAGVNAVLRSLPFEAGDELLTTDHAYPAVRNALAFVAGTTGARVVEAPVPFPLADAGQVVDAVAAAITPRTRLAVVDHVTSPTAVVFPVAALAALCRDRGVPLLIDGAHAPGMLALDIPAIGCDWYVGNAHKWLFAAKGCGLMWVDPARQDAVHPTVISHGFGKGYRAEFDWTGTRDPSAWLAVTDAIAFHRGLGSAALMARNHDLAASAAALLAERWGTETGAPAALIGATAAIAVPDAVAARAGDRFRLRERLWREHAVEAPVYEVAGRLWVRVSAQVYNEPADYERLGAAVDLMGKG